MSFITFQLFLAFFASLNFLILIRAYAECSRKKNAFGLTPFLAPLGSFVWGDAIIFSIFWICVSIIEFFVPDLYLFGLVISVFWAVRSFGETIYWFNQQFSSVNRNPVKSLWGHTLFHDDAVWFAYQIVWQCVLVASIISTIFFAHKWLMTV